MNLSTQWVVATWHQLREEDVDACTITMFEIHLDKYMDTTVNV